MVAVAAAGLAAGGINAVVGSGTLVTFPVLLAVGLPPVTASVSNSLGLVPGNVAGAIGYRRELSGQRRLLMLLVPASVLDRPPSAELRADQLDQDSLPPYDVLDAILAGYVEEDLDAAELVARGLPAEAVEQVIGLVDRAEYKRRQYPPGTKISFKAFGRDRRLPITNGWREGR